MGRVVAVVCWGRRGDGKERRRPAGRPPRCPPRSSRSRRARCSRSHRHSSNRRHRWRDRPTRCSTPSRSWRSRCCSGCVARGGRAVGSTHLRHLTTQPIYQNQQSNPNSPHTGLRLPLRAGRAGHCRGLQALLPAHRRHLRRRRQRRRECRCLRPGPSHGARTAAAPAATGHDGQLKRRRRRPVGQHGGGRGGLLPAVRGPPEPRRRRGRGRRRGLLARGADGLAAPAPVPRVGGGAERAGGGAGHVREGVLLGW